MEMEGISIDPEALGVIGVELQQQIDELAKSIHRHAGNRSTSPRRNSSARSSSTSSASPTRRRKPKPANTRPTSRRSPRWKASTRSSDILAWREATKLKSTYLDALPNHIVPRTGRIHTHFHQLVAATGRLASSDPNLQNIPVRSEAGRKIRKAFVPRKSQGSNLEFQILSCDYSQIELRVMAPRQ
jgi:DNA polymerase I